MKRQSEIRSNKIKNVDLTEKAILQIFNLVQVLSAKI